MCSGYSHSDELNGLSEYQLSCNGAEIAAETPWRWQPISTQGAGVRMSDIN